MRKRSQWAASLNTHLNTIKVWNEALSANLLNKGVGMTKRFFQTNHVRLANEEEFKGLFPDCDIGAMPPFGNLYGLDVYVDRSLAEDEKIIFQAGTHQEAIRMRYQDFTALVGPTVEEFHQPLAKVSEGQK